MVVFSTGNQPAKAKKKSAVQGRYKAQGRTSKNERHLIQKAKLALLNGKIIHHDGNKESDTEKDKNVEVAWKLTMEGNETMGFLVVTQEEM
jgi:hypothetical protein